MNESRKNILLIALPAIISNITVPLLGLVDTAIVGHLGSVVYIGAIAVGGMIFNILYWLFGFLRAGTSGFTSQALGANHSEDVTATLYRSSFCALCIAFLLLVGQLPIGEVAFRLMDATPEVENYARIYYRIAIWGAPAVLMLYGFNGWFIGMQNTKISMVTAVVQNVVNIVMSLFCVFVMGLGVAGIALGTVIAQYVGLGVAFLMWQTQHQFRAYRSIRSLRSVLRRKDLLSFLGVNRDIFLRTLCILLVTSFFTAVGARQGNLILAVNTILLQLFYIFSYFMDGFSNAAEALSGKWIGARSLEKLKETIHETFRWGWILVLAFTLLYGAVGMLIMNLLTDDAEVLRRIPDFHYWIVLVPLCGFAAFLWDGIFIGMTATKELFWSMLLASLGFFLCYFLVTPFLGNHGLWLSFCLFLFLRGLFQYLLFPRVLTRIQRIE